MADTPLIMTPGPVGVPAFVIDAIARPAIHQRSDSFKTFFGKLQGELQYLFQTSDPVLTLAGSGTFAVQVAMRSLFQAGDQVAVAVMGKFSQRWLAYGKALGLQVLPMQAPWGQNLEVGAILELVRRSPDLKGLVLTHSDTSTGVAIDLETIAFEVRQIRPEMLIVVDAMSTVGAQPLYTSAWDLDAVVTSAQKSLFNPAGAVFVALSARAISQLEIPPGDDAMHLGHYWKYLAQGSFPFTPPTQLLYGVVRALEEIRRQGLPHRWNLCQQSSRLFKRGIQEMGGQLFGEANGHNMTVFSVGNGSQDALRTALKEAGFELAGGQDHLRDRVMRIGHFGWLTPQDHEACLAALAQLI